MGKTVKKSSPNSFIRKTWDINPETKVKNSDLLYKRNKNKSCWHCNEPIEDCICGDEIQEY